MKKAKLLTLSVLSLFTLALASCGEENAPTEELVLNAYNNVLSTCKTIEQTITISHEGLVYATEEITINTRNGSKTTVTKVANSLDSDTPWTETSEYEVVDLSKANQKLEVSMFTSLTANESLHTAQPLSTRAITSNKSHILFFIIFPLHFFLLFHKYLRQQPADHRHIDHRPGRAGRDSAAAAGAAHGKHALVFRVNIQQHFSLQRRSVQSNRSVHAGFFIHRKNRFHSGCI